MAIAFRELRQQLLVELEPGGRIDRIDAVLLVGKAAQHDAPVAFALFQEVVEAPEQVTSHMHAFDLGALQDRHLGLRDGALAFDVDR